MVATTVKATVPDITSAVMKPSAVSTAMVGVGQVAGRVAINEGLAGDWADGVGADSRVSVEDRFVTSPRLHRQCQRDQNDDHEQKDSHIVTSRGDYTVRIASC